MSCETRSAKLPACTIAMDCGFILPVIMPGSYAVFHKQLGDLVLLQPALKKMRDHFGGPVHLLTRSGHADLVQLMEGVHFVSGLPWKPCRALLAFDPLRKSAFRSLLAPAAKKECVLPNREEIQWYQNLVYKTTHVPELGEEYIAEYFWKTTPLPGTRFEPPSLQQPPPTWKPAGLPTGAWILLNVTAGWPKKSWEATAWASVAKALHEAGHACLLAHGPADWQIEHAREILAACEGYPIQKLGGTSLREFLWLCANARMVLTVDGSASHLASAFGVPCLTLFGPTNIHHWHRPSPHAQALQAGPSKDGKCRLRNLPPESVVPVALKMADPIF